MDISDFIQLIITIITLISVILIYRAIKFSEKQNQRIIFNEIVNQERALRMKLHEYRNEIHKRKKDSEEYLYLARDYDTLLFNYYEYLAICILKKFVEEKDSKLYFYDLLKDVKIQFQESILFKDNISEKKHYRGILWLFKKWKL